MNQRRVNFSTFGQHRSWYKYARWLWCQNVTFTKIRERSILKIYWKVNEILFVTYWPNTYICMSMHVDCVHGSTFWTQPGCEHFKWPTYMRQQLKKTAILHNMSFFVISLHFFDRLLRPICQDLTICCEYLLHSATDLTYTISMMFQSATTNWSTFLNS